MAAIDSNTLLEEAKCYACYGGSMSHLLKIALLRRQLLAISPTADVSPQGLISYANCYGCYGATMMDLIEISLLDKIAQA